MFKSATMDGIGPYNIGSPMPYNSRGTLDISDCNLVQAMIAKGMDLNGAAIKYLLDTFTLTNKINQDKKVS